MQMRFVAGRSLEGGGLDLDEPLALEMAAHRADDPRAQLQPRAPVGVAVGLQKGEAGVQGGRIPAGETAIADSILSGLWPRNRYGARRIRASRRLEDKVAAAVPRAPILGIRT